jgi:hypothetical protein
VGEFQAWFSTGADCLDYLEWVRWPRGFVCPECGFGRSWRLGDGRIMCVACGHRTSVTAGTIFDRTRTPLTVWFTACWLFATAKDGISALSLQKALEVGSYQTAWAMLGRLRSVLVRPGRDRLAGRVEVDETYIGGEEPGLRAAGPCAARIIDCVAELRSYLRPERGDGWLAGCCSGSSTCWFAGYLGSPSCCCGGTWPRMLSCWCSGTRTLCCGGTPGGSGTSRLTGCGSPPSHS